MFGFKKRVHRDQAALLFMDHCKNEATNLRDRLVPILRGFCDGKDDRPTLEAVIDRPFMQISGAGIESVTQSLLDVHCLAICTSLGLSALRENIDPRDQVTAMEWQLNRLIAIEDVGENNVGHSPSPRTPSGGHILYSPGTLVGGVPSQQQKLTHRYLDLQDTDHRLVLFLISLRVFVPSEGIGIAVYEETALGDGMFGRNLIGYKPPQPDQFDEWENDLEILDPHSALQDLPASFAGRLREAVKMVDPFWPTFSAKHRLKW